MTQNESYSKLLDSAIYFLGVSQQKTDSALANSSSWADGSDLLRLSRKMQEITDTLQEIRKRLLPIDASSGEAGGEDGSYG